MLITKRVIISCSAFKGKLGMCRDYQSIGSFPFPTKFGLLSGGCYQIRSHRPARLSIGKAPKSAEGYRLSGLRSDSNSVARSDLFKHSGVRNVCGTHPHRQRGPRSRCADTATRDPFNVGIRNLRTPGPFCENKKKNIKNERHKVFC